jgi:hypothetical protein
MKSADKYYSLLKEIENNKRLIEHEQLRSLVQKPSIFNKLFKGKIMKLMWSSSAIIASIGALWFFGLFGSDKPEHQFENAIAATQKKEAVVNIDDKQITFPANSIPVLHLSKQELENIGIKVTEDGYEFITQSRLIAKSNIIKAKHHGYPDVSEDAIMREKNFIKYNNAKISSEVLDYKGWEQNEINYTCPVTLIAYNHNKSVSSSSFGFVPVFSRSAAAIFYNDDNGLLLKQIYDDKINVSEVDYIELKDKTEYIQNSLIVHLPTKKMETMLFYLPSEELLDKLPERYQSLLTQSMAQFQVHKKMPETKTEPEQTKIAGIGEIELEPDELERLNITKEGNEYSIILKIDYNISGESLSNISLNPKDYGIDESKISSKKDYFNTFKLILKTKGYKALDSGFYYAKFMFSLENDNKFIIAENRDYGNIPDIMLYTDNKIYSVYDKKYNYWSIGNENVVQSFNGGWDVFRNNFDYSDSKGRYVSSSDKILPLTFTLGNPDEKDTTKIKYKNVELWFNLNEDFVTKLPERYRKPLSKELELSDAINKGEITSAEACDILAGESNYLNLCEKQSENIQISNIYPMPAQGYLNIALSANDVNLKIDLYSGRGEKEKSLFSSGKRISGYNEMKLDLKGVSRGVYLLYFTTDKGDVISKKIIVE